MTRSDLDSLGLPPGTASYVDREWLTGTGSPVPALSFAPDGAVSWCGHQLGRLAPGADAPTVAARALCRVASDAAVAVSEQPRGAVEVVGAGLVAAHVRRLVGDGRRLGDTPGVVVDTTGDPEVIRSALDRVCDLGMVVLAGEAAGATLDLDLYSTVHRRGLVVVGVASPRDGFDAAPGPCLDEVSPGAYLEQLAEVSAGGSFPDAALWYRFLT